MRVLVDRLWPRGLTKREARVGLWAQDLAPSEGLRRWFDHDPARWQEFKSRYFAELDKNAVAIQEFVAAVPRTDVTFVYGSLEPEFNNATALKAYFEQHELLD